MSKLLEAALSYAEMGWHIFPLRQGTKKPLHGTHGVLEATADCEKIKAWWLQNPQYNIGLACGKKSGTYVIDVDLDYEKKIDGYQSLKEFPPLPRTIQQYTPRGGFHAFFRTDNPPANKNNFRPGIDIRGDGYYVLLTPSLHPNGGVYRWIPDQAPWEYGYAEYPNFMRYVKNIPWASFPNGSQISGSDEDIDVVRGKSSEDVTFFVQDDVRKVPWAAEITPDPLTNILEPQGLFNTKEAPRAKPVALAATRDERPPAEDARGPSKADLLRRASLYLAECDPAIQGNGGHDKLLWAAVAMVHGFTLTNKEALTLLELEYNPRCIPEWNLSQPGDRKDFTRKVNEARKLKPQYPYGWLLEDITYSTAVAVPQEIKSGALGMIQNYYKDKPEVSHEEPSTLKNELEYLQNPLGVVGEICQWINSTAIKKQPFLALACTLTFFGGVLGRKVKDRLENRTNLYCMGIAPSSAGKAHAPNQIRKLCEHAGCLDLLGGDEAASDAAIECRLERNPATLFLWDEIGLLLSYIQSGSNPHVARIVSLLMKLYSSACVVYKGREYAEENKQRTIVQPCCCIYGTSTPTRFSEGITLGELQDGWLSRCLVFESSRNPPKTRDNCSIPLPADISDLVHLWYFREINKDDSGDIESFTAFQSRTGSVTAQAPVQIMVKNTKASEKIFVKFDNESIRIGNDNQDMACLWAKAEENARKIALIIACGVNFENPEITADITTYACRLIRYLLVRFINNTVPMIVSSKVDFNKQKILEIIAGTGHKGCLTRLITKKARWSNMRQRKEILDDLREGEEIIVGQKEGIKGVFYWTPKNFNEYKKKENFNET